LPVRDLLADGSAARGARRRVRLLPLTPTGGV
jgi:hypothetical protein